MSRLSGGLFSQPSGNNNGLVFGKARTRDGKKTTVREKVNPANPNTNAQQTQRTRFTYALNIVKDLGRSVYQIAWNSAVGNLPGFQSMMSIFTDNTDGETGSLSVPSPVTLGSRHGSDMFSASSDGAQISTTFSTEIGDVGADDDIVHTIVIAQDPETGELTRATGYDTSATRTDGASTVTPSGQLDGAFICGIYFEGVGESIPSEQIFSECQWVEVAAPT